MRSSISIIFAICLTLICLGRIDAAKPGAESVPQTARTDLKKLQGTWERVAMEVEGEAAPEALIEGWSSTYEGNRLTLRNKDGVYRHCIVTLAPERTPKATNTWDLEGPFEDQTLPGIYEIDGDVLKLCFAKPGSKRPTEFTTKKGTGFLYFEYKRKKD
jgi:uncharacterized protein (TIGR03067 family)